jgi:hypothetical protein
MDHAVMMRNFFTTHTCPLGPALSYDGILLCTRCLTSGMGGLRTSGYSPEFKSRSAKDSRLLFAFGGALG